ncbi:MAG: NAD(P)-dependent oxidoreductase [Sphingobacteriaceae bacterium]|jgi:nucleoside-diphosphate-sugar epimerase|nr:NAD(P)-dependent oxidoreductase [Sphingobacteriaceae bacterium]
MVNFSSVSVLGCGWLGHPLAKHLVRAGYAVKGSTTSPEKLELLKASGIEPYLVQFPIDEAAPSVESFFQSELVIVNIPPKGNPKGFIEAVKAIAELASGKAKHVVLISSTSVYTDTNSIITEKDEPSPTTASGAAMVTTEQILHSQKSFTTTIIRFAGLIGPGRHPGKFLAGKKNVPNGLSPVNLIHLDDCIGIVIELLSREAFGHTFNGCSPSHPTRKEFYTKAAQSLNLEPPDFVNEKLSYKIVESKNVPAILNYQFKIADLLQWLT